MQSMMMSITTILMLESMLKEMSTFKIKMDTLLPFKMELKEQLSVVKWPLMKINLMLMEVIMVLEQLTETLMRKWKTILKNMSLQITLNLLMVLNNQNQQFQELIPKLKQVYQSSSNPRAQL